MDDSHASDWHDMPDACAFASLIGPLQRRHNGRYWTYGLRILPAHTNSAGFMHGGLMTAFLDETIGSTVAQISGRKHVTIQLNTNFLHAVKVGDFLEGECEVAHGTTSMTFAQSRVLVASRIVATATAIFKAIPDPRKT
jgi:uncharacterized protein (TIGR00369 family)